MTRSTLIGVEALVAGTAFAALGVWYAPAPVAIPAGLLLAFVLPGLALVRLIQPRATRATGSARSTADRAELVERAVLVPALSLAVLVVGGLVLYACGIRLDLHAWTALTATVTLLAAALTMVRTGRPNGPGRLGAPPAGSIGAPPAGQRSAWLTARTVVPLALIVALLGGAGWLSLTTSQASERSGVTSLAVAPDTAAVAADGTAGRSVVVDVTSGQPGLVGLVIRIHSANPIPAEFNLTLDQRGQWSHRLTLPPGVVTIELYRRGDLVPYRSVSLAGTA